MDAQRSQILNLLADGTLSADQAAEQLRGGPQPARQIKAPASAKKPGLTGRWLHIRVTSLPGGQPKVSLNLPLNLVAFGLNIGARFTPELAGIDLDDLLASLSGEAIGPLIDVEDLDDGERVQIYID